MLKGNLAPDGCVIKPSACEPRLLKHTGPALVFDDYPAMKAAIDDDDLDVTADHVLVLRNAGPQGGPGMPEWGMLPIPKKLVKQGVRDMLRLSDARMSGTSYGACILHVVAGGAMSAARSRWCAPATSSRVDMPARRITLEVSDEELEARRAPGSPPRAALRARLRLDVHAHIRQAHEGCDFDFLETELRRACGRARYFLIPGDAPMTGLKPETREKLKKVARRRS